MEQQCLFCNIINGKIPSYKVYEDNSFIAILDINPANAGHLMLIPKKHMTSIMEMPDVELAKFFSVARGLSLALLEYGAKGINFLYGMGEAAGQRTPHAFMHVIPRYENDKVNLVWEPQKFSEEDFKNQQQKIYQIINKSKQQPQQQQPQQQYQQPRQHQQPRQQQYQQPQQQYQQPRQQQQIQQTRSYPQQSPERKPQVAREQNQSSMHKPHHQKGRPTQTKYQNTKASKTGQIQKPSNEKKKRKKYQGRTGGYW